MNTITLVVLLCPWAIWLVWEIVLLIKRAQSGWPKPGTISMVALERGHHLNSLAYLWGGMATHWWWPSEKWGSIEAGVMFWVFAILLLVNDTINWREDFKTWPSLSRFMHHPILWLAVGAFAGRFLFPQVAS